MALVVGAGVATGAYALIDDGNATQASKVIVVEQPAHGSAAIPGKNEASTAAAISHSGSTAISGKDEAATAAAISHTGGIEPRGSKASATGTTTPGSAEQLRSDPHGPAISLRNP